MSFPGATLVSAAHSGVVTLRNRLYDSGRLKRRSLPRPVISVGNLTLGGTGKTPFVESLAHLLSEEGYIVCILSRGYASARRQGPLLVSDLCRLRAGATMAGDEPYWLARRLPGVPVVVGANRFEAGLFALERLPVHVFLLDDGFQHRSLHRDLDVVLVDATDPWGGGHALPAGTLREPKSALRRAHAIGLTRLHQCDGAAARAVQAEVQQMAPGVPLFGTRARTTGLRCIGQRGLLGVDAVAGRNVLAFAGIGKPAAFFTDLEMLGAKIVARRPFPDHHAFTRADLQGLIDAAIAAGATALVTTEKDAMRLPPPPLGAPEVLALRQSVESEDPAALLRFVLSKLPGQK